MASMHSASAERTGMPVTLPQRFLYIVLSIMTILSLLMIVKGSYLFGSKLIAGETWNKGMAALPPRNVQTSIDTGRYRRCAGMSGGEYAASVHNKNYRSCLETFELITEWVLLPSEEDDRP
jgi:hypothetical protein